MKRLFCAVTLASWLLSSAALAQPDEAAKLVARELMARGRAQRQGHDFEGALASFSKAHAIMHVPTTLLEAARARVDTGQWLEALKLLRELPSMPAAANEPAPFAHAREEALQLERELEARLPSIRLDLSGAPQGAAPLIAIDGVARPDCASSCHLDPGQHVVTASTPRAMAEEQLRLSEREQRVIELVFSPLEAPQATTAATSAAAPQTTTPTRDGSSRRVPLVSWIAGGVALAGLTTGAVLGLNAVSERDDLRRRCAPNCSGDDVDEIRRQVVMTNFALGIGLSAAVVAVVGYVVAPQQPIRTGARRLNVTAAPDAQARGAYLALDGQF